MDVCVERSIVDGLGLLYSDDEVSNAIDESKKVLRKYRQLKIAKKLKMPSVKSPTFSDMPRGGSGIGDTALDKYIDVISQLEEIERCVERCEPTASNVLRQKYLSDSEYPQWKLAELTGYSISRYNDYLRQALLQFATAYRII